MPRPSGALAAQTTAIVLLTFASTAQAQVYGDTVGCQMLAGERPVSDSMFLYDGTTIQRMESACPVTGSMQIGSGGVLLTVQCTGEGETWEDYYVLSTTADESTLNIQPEDTSGPATELRLCDTQ